MLEVGPGPRRPHALPRRPRRARPRRRGRPVARAALREDRSANARNVDLLFGDALRSTLAELDPAPGKLVANLPVQRRDPDRRRVLDRSAVARHWCVMVQREVADRFFAEPRTKAYGAVSVLFSSRPRRPASTRSRGRSSGRRRTSTRRLVAFRRRPELPADDGASSSASSRPRSPIGGRRSRTRSSSPGSPTATTPAPRSRPRPPAVDARRGARAGRVRRRSPRAPVRRAPRTGEAQPRARRRRRRGPTAATRSRRCSSVSTLADRVAARACGRAPCRRLRRGHARAAGARGACRARRRRAALAGDDRRSASRSRRASAAAAPTPRPRSGSRTRRSAAPLSRPRAPRARRRPRRGRPVLPRQRAAARRGRRHAPAARSSCRRTTGSCFCSRAARGSQSTGAVYAGFDEREGQPASTSARAVLGALEPLAPRRPRRAAAERSRLVAARRRAACARGLPRRRHAAPARPSTGSSPRRDRRSGARGARRRGPTPGSTVPAWYALIRVMRAPGRRPRDEPAGRWLRSNRTPPRVLDRGRRGDPASSSTSSIGWFGAARRRRDLRRSTSPSSVELRSTGAHAIRLDGGGLAGAGRARPDRSSSVVGDAGADRRRRAGRGRARSSCSATAVTDAARTCLDLGA